METAWHRCVKGSETPLSASETRRKQHCSPNPGSSERWAAVVCSSVPRIPTGMPRKQFCAVLSHAHKYTQCFVKMLFCPSLHGKMCFPPKHKLLFRLQLRIQKSALLVARCADQFGTSSEQTHQKKSTLGEEHRSKQPEFTVMNFFGSPKEHFHCGDYFKTHSGKRELGET